MDYTKKLGGLLVAGALAAAAPTVADELFLRLEGIPGESRDARHKDEIDVLSYSQSLTGPFAQSATAAGSTAKTTCGPVKVTKYLDRTSSKLMLYAANGQHIPKAMISFRKQGAKDDYYRVTLDDVVVTEVQQTGEGGTRYAEAAREVVSLIGRRYEWAFFAQAPDGRPAGKYASYFDCVQVKGG